MLTKQLRVDWSSLFELLNHWTRTENVPPKQQVKAVCGKVRIIRRRRHTELRGQDLAGPQVQARPIYGGSLSAEVVLQPRMNIVSWGCLSSAAWIKPLGAMCSEDQGHRRDRSLLHHLLLYRFNNDLFITSAARKGRRVNTESIWEVTKQTPPRRRLMA